ncbi:MAG: class I SAM-dependent methyltransferase [Deltaproteobacteria bacterium]|nr:class I SAM-dependent methyltransferase [Deltaproteobacteria bacterium]
MSDPRLQPVACNLCGRDDCSVRYSVNGMRLVRCNACGLSYFNPRLADEDIARIYRGDYFCNGSIRSRSGPIYGYQDYLGDKRNIQQDFSRKIDSIRGQVRRGRVLEIGCAFGFFLELMRAEGWRTEGIEPNPGAAAYASSVLGLDVGEGSFMDRDYGSETYELVAMFDVVEHLVDPKAALLRIHRILKADGLLVLSTVDIDSLVARALGPKWEDIRRSRCHLWMFSKKTMSRMLRECGFEILDVSSYGKVFEVGFALRRAAPYNPVLFNALLVAARSLGIDRMNVHVDIRSKLCYHARKV